MADLASKRERFELHVPQASEPLTDKTITTVTYSGETGMSRFLYTFSLIEFTADSDTIVVTLQVSFPSTWEHDRGVLAGILGDGPQTACAGRPVASPSLMTQPTTDQGLSGQETSMRESFKREPRRP